MKTKLIMALIAAVAVLAGVGAAGFYFYKNLTQPSSSTELPKTENPPAGGEEVSKETRLVKNDFEITLPPGWQEATSSYEGILLLAVDTQEDVSGGVFQKLDFRTNLSVKSDDLAKYAAVGSFEDYVASVKTSLVQAIPGISFIQEETKMINGVQAVLIECSSRQEDADFKTLLVFVKGSGSTVYAISFNAFQDSWPTYRSLFYGMAESFKLKYKI